MTVLGNWCMQEVAQYDQPLGVRFPYEPAQSGAIVLVGTEVKNAVMPYLQYMKTKGTVSPEDLDLFTTVDQPEEVVAALKAGLAPPAPPVVAPTP